MTVFPANDMLKTTPNDIFLTNAFKKNTKNLTHYYRIDALYFLDKIIVDFSSTNKNVTMRIVNSNNLEMTKEQLNQIFKITKLHKQDEIGKDLLMVSNNLSLAMIEIKCSSPPEKDLYYTFRYSSGTNYTFNYEYDNNPKYDKNKTFGNSLNLTIDKIHQSNYVITYCNYYIKMFIKNEEEEIDKTDYTLSTSFKNQKPSLIYKINYDDDLLKETHDHFNVVLNITLEKIYEIEITAEIYLDSGNYEYLAYQRQVIDKLDKKNTNYTLMIIIFSFIGIILIIGVFVIFCIFCYKKKSKALKKKVARISLALGETNPFIKEDISMEEDDDVNEDLGIF